MFIRFGDMILTGDSFRIMNVIKLIQQIALYLFNIAIKFQHDVFISF